jgi:hypothetical protein
MAACEKCWADAGAEAFHMGGSQTDIYCRLLLERADNPCSPEEQHPKLAEKIGERE